MASSVTTTEAVVEPPPKTMEVPAAVPPPNTPEPPAAAPLPKVSEVPAAVPPVSDPLEAEKPGSNLAVAALSRKRSSAVSSEAAQKKFSILKKEGRIAKKLMEYYDSKSNFFTVEFRPNKRKSDGEWMTSNKLSPEDSWTSVKRIELDGKILRTFRENPDLDRGKLPDIYKVSNDGNFYIGMDGLKNKCVVTDRNPHLEGLLDIHRCIYLPSSFEKNQTLPGYLTQNILFIELPSAPIYSPGIAPGMFMVTPKLVGCNIFVAHDPGLHKFWVLRISGKDPQKPPDLGKKVTAQPKVDSRPAPTVVKRKPTEKQLQSNRVGKTLTTAAATTTTKTKTAAGASSSSTAVNQKDEKTAAAAAAEDDSSKAKKINGVGMALNENKKAGGDDDTEKKKNDTANASGNVSDELIPTKEKTITSQREEDESGRKLGGGGAVKPRKKTVKNVILHSNEDTSGFIEPRNRFESEEIAKANARRSVFEKKISFIVSEGRQMPEDWVKSGAEEEVKTTQPNVSNDLMSVKRRFKKHTVMTVDDYGQPANQPPWRPPTAIRQARQKEIESGRKPKSWTQFFREYRGYAECVLDLFRTQGYNAHFTIRVATDRNWTADVRDQQYWLNDVNRVNQCNHFMYRGEGIFYGVYTEGTWKFGLKDINNSTSRSGVDHKFPLESRQHYGGSDLLGKEALSGLVPGAKPDKSKQKEKKAELAIQEISFEELNRMNVKKKTIKAGRRAVLLGKQGRLLDAVRENTKVDEKETDEGEIQEDTAAQKKVTIVEIKPPVV